MKKVQDLNVEDLLKELETGSDEKLFRTDGVAHDGLTFLNVFNVKPGKDFISKIVLYQIYHAWSKKRMAPRQFARFIASMFVIDAIKIFIDEEQFKIKREDWIHFHQAKRPKSNEPANRRSFEAFIQKFEIKPGKVFINLDSLTMLYSRFLNEKKRKVSEMTKAQFLAFLRLHFKEKITNYYSYFAVSETIWKTLNQEDYYEKEKNKKKFKKVPRLSS